MSESAPVPVGRRKRGDPPQDDQGVAPAIQIDDAQPIAAPEDRARASIKAALEIAQPDRNSRELTAKERNESFAAEVKARSASAAGGSQGRDYPANRGIELDTSKCRSWDAVPEAGTTIEDLLNPYYWRHYARKFTVWDRVWCRWEDGSQVALLTVCEQSQLFARMAVILGPVPLAVSEPDVDGQVPPGHEVKWMGEVNKYCVLRGNQKIREGFSNKSSAVAWLRNLMTAMRNG